MVTGGYAGIGLETTRTFVLAGATVIVPARNLGKAGKSLAGMENVEIASMDLMDPVSINAFAEKFLASGGPLHLLINNAGIMWVPLQPIKTATRLVFPEVSGHMQWMLKMRKSSGI